MTLPMEILPNTGGVITKPLSIVILLKMKKTSHAERTAWAGQGREWLKLVRIS
jgi:hypothetical protein